MSSDKTIDVCEIEHISDLSVIGQDVVDAMFRHNGMTPPSSVALLRPPRNHNIPSTLTGEQLTALVGAVPPDCGYAEWTQVGMVISNETSNSDEGYAIWDEWSSKGNKYSGPAETRYKWESYRVAPDNPVGIGTLCKIISDRGVDPQRILLNMRERFKKVPFEITYPKGPSKKPPDESGLANPLDRYSLSGSSGELEKKLQDEVFVLKDIALLGQATAIYAAPNCGKTLGVISMLSDAIMDNRIDPQHVYYFNADDNLRGLVDKVKIAEEFGFKMIGDGFRGFRADMLLPILSKMIEDGTAAGAILIVDTAKRFTDLMSKRSASEFTAINRRFVSQGGTVIALAHVNKKKSDSGKSVYAGTSDIIDDFDCAYVIELIDDGISTGRRVIAFENQKSRGSVAPVVHFTYLSPDSVGCYQELMESFCQIDTHEVDQAATVARIEADASLIAIVRSAIQAGPAAKKDLITALQEQANTSRNAASTLIERYCGDDPAVHLWAFERGTRGVHQYRLL